MKRLRVHVFGFVLVEGEDFFKIYASFGRPSEGGLADERY